MNRTSEKKNPEPRAEQKQQDKRKEGDSKKRKSWPRTFKSEHTT